MTLSVPNETAERVPASACSAHSIRDGIPTWLYGVCAHLLMLPLMLLVAATFWAYKASGVLYTCTDSTGIFDFIPPWVHPDHGDTYIAPALCVYLVWFALLAAIVFLPWCAYWILSRRWPEV